MNRPKTSASAQQSTIGLQCICCGHVEAPAANLVRCRSCGGLDTRPFVADILEGQEDERELRITLVSPKETS